MANYVKTREQLKDLSDKQLENYVKNPNSGVMTGNALGQGGANTIPGAVFSGDVPLVLVLGEIKRRKDTRATYAKEKDKAATTVADDLTTPSMPSGLRSMAQTQPRSPVQPTAGVGSPQPTPQMNPTMLASKGIGQLNPGSMRKMADGGIVNFNEGGYTPGELIQQVQAANQKIAPQYKNIVTTPAVTQLEPTPQLITPAKTEVRAGLPVEVGGTLEYDYSPGTKDNPIVFNPLYNDPAPYEPNKIRPLLEKEKEVLEAKFKAGQNVVLEDVNRYKEINKLLTEGSGYTPGNAIDEFPTTLRGDSKAAAIPSEETIIESDVSEVDGGIDETESLEEVIRRNRQTNQAGNSKKPSLDRPDLDVFKDIENVGVVDFKSLKDMFDKDRTAATKEVLETNEALGLSKDPFKNSLQRIKNMREKVKDSKSEAGNLALIEAGLLIAQKGNIGDAAQAVQNYGKALKDLRGEDREIAKLDIQLEAADIAFKTGQAREVGLLLQSYQKGMKDISVAELNAAQNVAITNSNNRYKGLVGKLQAQTSMYGSELAFEGTKNKSKTATESLLDNAKNDPAYYKKDSKGNAVFDAEKFIRDTNRASSYGGADLTYRLINAYNDRVKQLEDSLDQDALDGFKEQYPNEQAYVNAFLGMNSGLGSTAGSGTIDYSSLK